MVYTKFFTLEIAQQPFDGRLETAYSRTTGFNVSGQGVIATFGFIVDDELDGFRSDGLYPLNINLSDGIGMNGLGENVGIPGAQTTVFVNLDRSKKSPTENDVLVFPNPTSGIFNMYLNGGHEITSYEVFSALGSKVMSKNITRSKEVQADLSGLQNGMYFIQINTTDKSIVKKVEIID